MIASALALRIRRLTGWRRGASAFAAGLAAALSTAPLGLWPVLFLAFPVLVVLLDSCRGRGWRVIAQAAGIGWWFGFGYFLASLWWVGNAFLVEADVFAWLLPIAVIALPAGLALFTALGLAVARALWSPGAGRIFAFATGLTASEWLRGHVLTGFPWNSFGYALAENAALAQSAALAGLWGLTLAATLLGALPALLADPPRAARARVVLPAAGLGLLIVAFAWGSWRLSAPPAALLPGVHLRIMQPNLPQDEKFAYTERRRILDDYLALSAAPSAAYPNGLADVTLLIWPESAFPFLYEREPWARARIAATLPKRLTLVTGAARYGVPPPGQTSPFFNSIRVMDGSGEVLQSADKVHLVPFGEYLPFQSLLESLGIEQLTRQRGGFASGERLVPLRLPGLPAAAPLICYEAIFPGAVLPQGERPGFLLNVTNDGWFGATPGPYQHYHQARLRAIEEGLPLVRAANTGISAVVDSLGREVATLSLGEKGNLDVGLPQALEKPLLAAPAREFVFILLFSICFLGALVSRCRPRIS